MQLDGITSPQSVALILWLYDVRVESSVEMMDCKFMMWESQLNSILYTHTSCHQISNHQCPIRI